MCFCLLSGIDREAGHVRLALRLFDIAYMSSNCSFAPTGPDWPLWAKTSYRLFRWPQMLRSARKWRLVTRLLGLPQRAGDQNRNFT